MVDFYEDLSRFISATSACNFLFPGRFKMVFLKSFGVLKDIGGTLSDSFQLGNLLSKSALDFRPVQTLSLVLGRGGSVIILHVPDFGKYFNFK